MSSPLPLGLPTAAPAGYAALCARDAGQCPQDQASDAGGVIAADYRVPAATTGLSPERWALLNSVNRAVNQRVRYVTDEAQFGQPDVWAPATDEGDCEDYALAKRQMLWAAGWKPDDLSLALVQSPQTGPHAVLIANTLEGAYVLDNANSWVLPWNKTEYSWVTAQDAEGRWRVAGENARAVLLAEAAVQRQGIVPAGAGRMLVAGISAGPAATAPQAGVDGSGRQIPDVSALEPGSR